MEKSNHEKVTSSKRGSPDRALDRNMTPTSQTAILKAFFRFLDLRVGAFPR